MTCLIIVSSIMLLCSGVFANPINQPQFSYESFGQNFTSIGELSPDCQKTAEKFNLTTPEFWLMVDASSRIPSAISRGNFYSMGNYDVCLDIKTVETQFCKVSLNFVNNVQEIDIAKIHLNSITQRSGTLLDGIGLYMCVFKSCNEQDLNIMFKKIFNFQQENCWSKDSQPPLNDLAIIAIVIFCIFAAAASFSTIYELYLIYWRVAPFHPILVAFSLWTNTIKLFSVSKDNNQLQCLNGLKSISMLWVVMGHVYMAFAFSPVDNYLDIYNWMNNTTSQYIIGATVSVDTFFVVGGFLTMYTFQTSMDKGIKFNIPMFYIHRYLRLTPALAAMVLAHVALFNYFGSGPVWNNTNTFLVEGCKNYWWSALLYVQNYVNPNGVCVPQSWYLSVDMQLFLISPVLLLVMRHWSKWGYVTLSFLSILSILASFLITWFMKLSGLLTGDLSGHYAEYYYMPTHTRLTPYLFGIMMGCYMHSLKKYNIKLDINTKYIFGGWVLAMALLLISIFGGSTLQFKEYDRLASAFFNALIRPSWALAICWIIFACLMDYAGPINDILSLSLFQILSRLCYSIYLVHYSYIFLTNFYTRAPYHFTEYNAFHKFWGDLICSTAIAILWTLIFESPIITIEKLLLRRSPSQTEKKLPLV